MMRSRWTRRSSGRSRLALSAALAVLFVGPPLPLRAADTDPEPGRVEFNRDIRPILSNRCFACHGPDATHRKADLRLDTPEGANADLGDYRAIEPGDIEASELFYRISTDDALDRMPPDGEGEPLSLEEVELFRRWIEQGAEYQPHWSYLRPERPTPPEVADVSWPRAAIDRFLLAAIESEGLAPSPEAARSTLLRRLCLDLTGLPPTPEMVQAYLADDSTDAYERMVDRLLASPRFGERLAMYWLDLVRYADTVGYHGDQEHHASPYRDWVIGALNANMPFDQFTREQLAGDLLPGSTIDQKVASGYNRLLQTTHEGGTQDKEYLAKYAADRVRNVSTVWMGATMGCAECHDHKFDPYSQEEFYSFGAFFADIEQKGAYPGPDRTPTVRAPEIDILPAQDRPELACIEADLAPLLAELERMAPFEEDSKVDVDAEIDAIAACCEDCAEHVEGLKGKVSTLEGQRAELMKDARRMMITVAVEPREMRVLPRGDWLDDSGKVVQPSVPAALGSITVEGEGRADRLDLADWLTDGDHPQTARVLVNRLWYLYFGSGLSRTLEDNGSQGAWPTHPALLDWLAVEFVESGWDVKHMVRLMVTSSAYRQTSVVSEELRKRDPENRLFARQARPRLQAEMIRDGALAIAGLLAETPGGPPARPYQPIGYYSQLNFPRREYVADQDENQYRRGVYMHWQRQYLHPMLRAFDAPTREECTAERPVSNTPLAALALMNDPTFVEAARCFAARIVQEGGSNDEDRLRWAWRVALAREPEPKEVAALARHLEQSRQHYASDPSAAEALLEIGLAPWPEGIASAELAAWTSVARAILNLHETITRN